MEETKTLLDIDVLETIINRMNLIAHETRISIINLLQEKGKLSVTDIFTELKMEQPVCSNHLRLLKEAGVLGSTRKGQKNIYSVKTKALKNLLDTVARCNNA